MLVNNRFFDDTTSLVEKHVPTKDALKRIETQSKALH